MMHLTIIATPELQIDTGVAAIIVFLGISLTHATRKHSPVAVNSPIQV
jgi:hypothetical protein